MGQRIRGKKGLQMLFASDFLLNVLKFSCEIKASEICDDFMRRRRKYECMCICMRIV